jgi:hypothetical protein
MMKISLEKSLYPDYRTIYNHDQKENRQVFHMEKEKTFRKKGC